MEILDLRLKKIRIYQLKSVQTSTNVRGQSELELLESLEQEERKRQLQLELTLIGVSIVISVAAYKDAEEMRGAGDARSSEIYAKAYNKNAEFYDFYRSLNAYKSSFGNNNDVLCWSQIPTFLNFSKSGFGRLNNLLRIAKRCRY